ncbi:MAG TPA: hypothetical protein VMX97_08690 [Hyphomicrobiaceae bacterium]|nr:hypothetical protein [Hyphomicrobiaceae bacterium]
MIDGSVLVEAVVTALQGVPALVTAVDEDEERIYGYHDTYPATVSLSFAIHQIPSPGVMVSYEGIMPGSFGNAEVWKHQLAIYLRAGAAESGNPYSVMFAAIMTLQYATIHASCYPMESISLERRSDAEAVDFFAIPVTFTEIGG